MKMDVLVKWKDNTTNVVASTDLETLDNNNLLRSGVMVKMYWPPTKRYYFGVVLKTENEEFEDPNNVPCTSFTTQIEDDDSDDNIPLAIIKDTLKSAAMSQTLPMPKCQEEHCDENLDGDNPDPFECSDESDNDPTYKQKCQFRNCKVEIFSTCERCLSLLCWNHFTNNSNCKNHAEIYSPNDSEDEPAARSEQNDKGKSSFAAYAVDGTTREVPLERKKKHNQKKIAHALRTEGKAYDSPVSKKSMPARYLRPRCNPEKCKSKQCKMVTDDQRQKIFDAFYGTKSLQLQREFIVRHVATKDIKRKRTSKENSRRTRTLLYNLPIDNHGRVISVCKTIFLNTLGISEKTVRTALNKRTEEGLVSVDRRGGRFANLKQKDVEIRNAVLAHIQKFPRMESHFCRKSTTREFLHPDLTIKKMYHIYKTEHGEQLNCSYHTYRRVFNSLNISFHHPKKDQCSLCLSYKEGDEAKKLELEHAYSVHTAEKNAVRKKKEDAKEISVNNPDKITTAVFDLQQVIQLPISNESALYYRRRLSAFNFTIYNIGNRECLCFLWNEVISKRGANEISTCVAQYLHQLDTKGIEEVRLFADGCGGQNKNTIVLTMMLHVVTNAKNINKISISFFETNHGQSEGDSAHSCISTALSLAGDVFIPAQLPPILKLARRNLPYHVFTMNGQDFGDYKSIAENIRLRSTRKFDSGEEVDWTKIKEVMVNKSDLTHLFIKNSHLADKYHKLSLKRHTLGVLTQPVPMLNNGPIKLQADKYKDLVALCTGNTPVVRDSTFQQFFRDLPHH